MRHREDNAVKKRVFSLLLAACTVLSLCVPVMAAEEGIFEPEAPAFLAPEEEVPAAPVEMEEAAPADAPEETVVDSSVTAPDEEDGPTAAASGTCGASVTWNLAGGVLTISGTGPMKDYMGRSEHAPWYQEYITTVTIGSGVTTIGNEAFYECTGLRSISIPSTVTEIGDGAFEGCTSLPSISLPGGLKSIGSRAFYDCHGLKSISLPDTVTTVSIDAFAFCTGLTSVKLSSGMRSIATRVFAGCAALQTVTLPGGMALTTIGASAFDGCARLQSITIPGTVTSIGASAFQGCASLRSVTIPASVQTIGGYAFADCTSLSSVTLVSAATAADTTTFENTPWRKAQGSFVIDGGYLAAYQGPGGSVSIPSGVTTIGERAFAGRSDVTAVTIPAGVTSIAPYAFAETGIRSVTIPSGVTSIGDDAFVGCLSLSSLSIPGTVAEIGSEAFSTCVSLTSVAIPEGVKTIGSYAFMGCTAMHTVTLPSTVTDIGLETFRDCLKLRKIVINGATFTYKTNASGAGHDAYAEFLSPALIVYGSGTGNAQAYAVSMGVNYANISQQHRSGWVSEGGYTYCYEDGKRAADEWRTVDGARRRLDDQGHMMVGLQEVHAGGPDDGLYYFNSLGAMQVGWQNIRGSWYYFSQTQDSRYGAAMTGWVKLSGSTYYMDPETAVMYTGWHNIDGKRYYFNEADAGTEGVMAIGWKQIDGVWYLFNGDGSYVRQAQPGENPVEIKPPAGGTGWRYVPETGDYYYFKDGVRKGDYWVGFADGASAWANNWYYADATGRLLTGLQYLDDLKGGKAWYMLQTTDDRGEIGKMLTGWQWTYSDAGTGYFSPKYGSQGMCTYTEKWGEYNASTGLWGDGLTHIGS